MSSTVASSEFIALCRAQLRLLAEGLGASRSIVYLTEEPEKGGESKLLPIVVYPETEVAPSKTKAQIAPQSSGIVPISELDQKSSQDKTNSIVLSPSKSSKKGNRNDRRQLILPLVYDGTIVGLLMTNRETHPWDRIEQQEIQHIAETIALAGILDLRRQWLSIELHRQQQLSHQQQDILHNLLHQLRNPLTAIKTFAKLLIKRLELTDPNQAVANSIVRESDRLQELLKTLEIAIDINLIDRTDRVDMPNELPGNPNLSQNTSANLLLLPATNQIESCQLSDILDPLIITAEAIAIDRNLTFHSHIPQHLPLVHASGSALREILSNLIDNALKYTPAGGEVDIDVELGDVEQTTLQICIRDTGMGIPPQDLEKLFTRHYRGVQAQGSIAGTGLGLAIAKELVDRINGKIEAISPPPGSDRGTEFILCLKLESNGN